MKLTFLDLCPHVEHELPGFVADFTQYPERWRCQWCKLDRSVFSLTSNVQLPVCHPVTLRPELGTRPDLQFFLRRFVFFNLDRRVLDVFRHDVTELDGRLARPFATGATFGVDVAELVTGRRPEVPVFHLLVGGALVVV